MKTIKLLCLQLFLLICIGKAQTITNYSLTSSAGTFTALSGANSLSGTGTTDEGYWNDIPLGFDFWYMGNRYTTLSASTNGWLTLGAAITNAASTNNLSTGGSPRPVIAPLWDNLNIQAGSNVTYLTSGTVGSRIFTLQYLNVKWSSAATGNTISFQVKIYETNGKIEFVYRRETGSVSSGSASIGISTSSTGSGNFLSLNGTGNAPAASSVTETNTLNNKPATGQVYSFLSPTPTAPSNFSGTGILYNGVTLNWQDNSSNETGFIIYRSTDGVNYTYVSKSSANSTSSVQTGLSASTLYYWKIVAVTEGALSSALNGSTTTICASPPAPPTVTATVNYCQNAAASVLTATGSNLLWGGAISAVGGSAALVTGTYIDASYNNKKVNFTTTVANVTITNVDYYVPAYQSVTGIIISIYNNAGVVVSSSSVTTTLSAGATAVKISNPFNYSISTAGNYSIGVSSGNGNIGYDSPSFPLTEALGIVQVTGLSNASFRCFNNIVFSTEVSAVAPTPSTVSAGSTSYYVTQTVGGCSSAASAITVVVGASPQISQIPVNGIIGNYKFEGNANDVNGTNNGTLQNAPASATDRFGLTGKAYSFNGSTQYVSTFKQYNNPTNFTISAWFKTSSTTGGKLVGFGASQTGTSSQYDRHLYMNNAGQIYFGVYPSAVKTINSSLSYNDNAWHQATAVLSSTAGMMLYIDGALVASDINTTTAEVTNGYWKIGYDNINGWTSQPSSFYFNGDIDDVLIFHAALNASEIATLYTSPDGAGNNGPVCAGSTLNLNATTAANAVYSWTGPNSFSSALQNPSFYFSAANAGVYTLTATVNGCSTTAYTKVISSSNTGQWTGNISTDWNDTGNWCNGTLPSSSTNVLIESGSVRMPTIASNASCKNLTINNGASVTTTLAGTLNIAGNLVNNGTMVNNGTTHFNGTTGQQTFSGANSFYNFTLNNTAGIVLPTAISVVNNMVINAGTLNANNFSISVGGNWTNNASSGSFTAGTSTVNFSGTGNQVIGGSYSTQFNNLTITNSSAVVSLAINETIVSNLSVSAGTLDLGSFTANRLAAGGVLTVANNAVLKIGGTNSFPTNYSTINLVVASTVEYAGTNQNVSNQLYGNLKVSSSAGAVVKTFPATALAIVGNLQSVQGAGTSVTLNAGAAMEINGNVSIGASTIFNAGAFSHNIYGNWVNEGTFNGNTGTIVLLGTGSLVSGSGSHNFNNLIIGASQVSFSATSITLSGDLSTISSGSFSQASGGTLLMTGTSKTISGSGILLDNFSVSGSVTTTTSFSIAGNMFVSGTLLASSGTIQMTGISKTISGSGSKTFNTLFISGAITTTADLTISAVLNVNGSLTASSGTTTFTGASSLSGIANLYNATINGTSLQLSANAVLGIANVLTISSGIMDVTSSLPNTVNFNGTGAQNINAITYHTLLLSSGNSKTAVGNFTVNNNITIGAGTTFIPGSYTHTIYKNWNNNGIFTAGSSTIKFQGDQTSNITGATTFNIMTINNSAAATAILLQSDITAYTVNMVLGRILTGSNTLTITNTRTGNGIILGNIKRSHSFTTGVAYAFESPDNTISFSSVTSVTNITVSVDPNRIDGFPFGASINRKYTIAVPSGTYTATLRLHYEDDELNGNNETTMALWRFNGSVWTSSGKTGNSTSSNYVEQSGLTDITNSWTCSDQSNVVQWNGSVSSNWSTAANWTVLAGSASAPPAATDIVNLGTVAFTNQPAISSSVTVKNINFGSAQAVALSLSSGGTLTSGDIHGSWSSDLTHSININDQTMTVNGDLMLSHGMNGRDINIGIGSGSLTVNGVLTQSGAASIIFNGAGQLNLSHNFNHISGDFTAGNGTVMYSGGENQDLGAVTYHHLIINKSGAEAFINSPTTITGNLTIMAGELDNTSIATIKGNVLIESGATLENLNLMHVEGNWTNNGNFSASGANIYFDGTGTQYISASTFNNLSINKPVGSSAILTGDVGIKDNLTLISGTFNIKTFNCNRTTQGGTITLADSATFIVGANNSPLNFSEGTLATSSTVIADGVDPQYIFGVDFGNLIFRNGGLKTLVSPITVKGNLTIEAAAQFDAGAETLTLLGNWNNEGSFVPSASTIIMAGAGKYVSGNTTFNKVDITGSYTHLSDIVYNSLLHITNTGSVTSGTGIFTTLHGDLINNGILNTSGTTTFSGNVLQTLSLINAVSTYALTVNFNGSVSPVLNSTSAPQFGYLNINNTGGVNPSVGWTVAYRLSIGAGASFNGGTSTHNLMGDLVNNGTITSSGTINFNPITAVNINMGNGFTSTGRVLFAGTGAMTLAGNPVSFRNITISNNHTTGVTPSSNWTITNNLTIANTAIMHAGNFTYAIAGNIMNQGTLNAGSSMFRLNGTGEQEIYSLSPFYNLTIDKSSGNARLTSELTVNGNTNFVSGKIVTDSNKLVLTTGATVSGASQSTGWVNGFLQKFLSTGPLSIAFETGDNTKYTPLSFQFDNVTLAGNLVARSVSGDHPFISSSLINVAKSVNRHWNLSNLGVAFSSYSATAHYLPQDLDAGANPAMFGLSLYNGSSWTLPETGLLTDSASTLINATAINDLAIGEVCNKGTTIAYSGTPYCSASGNATVTVTGTTGGTFSALAGLSINTSTGLINLAASIPGTYSVIYTISAGGECPAYITSANITIDEAPTADGSYVGSPYCAGAGMAYPTGSGTAGGIFSSTTGLVIDSLTGVINLGASTPGNYQVSYTIAASGGCGIFSWSTPVMITATPSAVIEYVNGAYCSDDSTATVTLTGTTGGVYTSSPELSIDASTGLINIANSQLGSYTVVYTVAAAAGCSAFQTSTDVSIVEPGQWTGLVNSDWGNAGNWQCGNLPNAATNVTIHAGLDHYPVINTTRTLKNLVIEAGASIEVNGGTLQIAGSISNAGIFNVSTGTIEMIGTDLQTIPENAFTNHVIKNLVISNDVVIVGTDTLTGTLSFGASNKILVTGDSLILKSTATRTARIADMTNQGLLSGNVISGKVIIERYISAARGWRLLSVPIGSNDAPTINAAWQEGLTTASANPNLYPGYGVKISGGSTDNGFDQSNTNASFIKTYNNINNAFVALPGNPGTNIPINTYPAYFLYIRGNRSINLMQGMNSAITDATLRIHGQVKTGNQAEPVGANNFTLIGNPFASAIDFGSLTKNNVQNTMYVWDPKLSGSYGLGGYVTLNWNNVTGVYDKTASVSAISQYVPSGEAFFVRSADRMTAGTLTMKETDKTAAGADQVFRGVGVDQQLRVNLFLNNTDSSTHLLDGLLATFDDTNNDLVDMNDALKMSSGAENIGIKRQEQVLSIERRKRTVLNDTVFLHMSKMKVRDYAFEILMSNMESDGLTAILQDQFLGTNADKQLNMNGSTVQSFAISTDPGSYAANRFRIVFKKLAPVPVSFTAIKAAWNKTNIDVEWKVENEMGIDHYEVESSLTGNSFSTISTQPANGNNGNAFSYRSVDKNPLPVKHYYRVIGHAVDGRLTQSEIVLVNPLAVSAGDQVTIFPNPVIGNTLMIKLENVKKDLFTLQVFNITGQLVNSFILNHLGTESTYRFSLDNQLPAGKYQVKLSGTLSSYVVPMIKK